MSKVAGQRALDLSRRTVILAGMGVIAWFGLRHDFSSRRAHKREPISSMGADPVLHLFDLRSYQYVVLPAYRAFVDHSDHGPLLELFDRALPTIAARHDRLGLISMPDEVYQEYRDIVAGKVFYSASGEQTGDQSATSASDLRFFVDGFVVPVLLRLFCVPQTVGFHPEQNMSDPLLAEYLFERSRWIEDYFTFAKEPSGPVLELRFAEWGRLFSREELVQFDRELFGMDQPRGESVRNDLDNLRSLVRTASERPQSGLLLSIL